MLPTVCTNLLSLSSGFYALLWDALQNICNLSWKTGGKCLTPSGLISLTFAPIPPSRFVFSVPVISFSLPFLCHGSFQKLTFLTISWYHIHFSTIRLILRISFQNSEVLLFSIVSQKFTCLRYFPFIHFDQREESSKPRFLACFSNDAPSVFEILLSPLANSAPSVSEILLSPLANFAPSNTMHSPFPQKVKTSSVQFPL